MTAQREASPAALEVTDLHIEGQRGGLAVSIVDDVDLHVGHGKAVAIVGESGSGKSLTVRALLDLLPPGVQSTGSVTLDGRPLGDLTGKERHTLRGRELAFVMQDPFTMLNPLQRCGEQITGAIAARDGALTKEARRGEAVARLREVGITDAAVADRYPFELSGGMRQRVAIAAAIAEQPRVLVADEPTTALDVTTQREILSLLNRLRRDHDLSLVLITHDLDVAFTVCDRVYVMYAGTVVESGPVTEVADRPRHPYTFSLLQAKPPLELRADRLMNLPGNVPSPGRRPDGCRFAPRCRWATDECETSRPELRELSASHAARCLRVDQIADALAGDARSMAPVASTRLVGAESTQALVHVRDVRKVFTSGRQTKVAVDGADIDVLAGESVGLVGESGSGKTTLARMVVGLTRPTSGDVRVGGVQIGSDKPSRKDWAVIRGTAQMAFQDPYSTLNPFLSVGATLKEAIRLAPKTTDRRTAEELLELVGLPTSYGRRRPAQLSGGERQRIAIARALARNPRLIVCDEVVSALDVSVQAHVLNLLSDLRRELGIAYLFITHDLAVVRQVTERVYVLKDGRVVEHGSTTSVLDDPQDSYTQLLIESIPAHHRHDDRVADDRRTS